jgi:hypothetical protein
MECEVWSVRFGVDGKELNTVTPSNVAALWHIVCRRRPFAIVAGRACAVPPACRDHPRQGEHALRPMRRTRVVIPRWSNPRRFTAAAANMRRRSTGGVTGLNAQRLGGAEVGPTVAQPAVRQERPAAQRASRPEVQLVARPAARRVAQPEVRLIARPACITVEAPDP